LYSWGFVLLCFLFFNYNFVLIFFSSSDFVFSITGVHMNKIAESDNESTLISSTSPSYQRWPRGIYVSFASKFRLPLLDKVITRQRIFPF
jgi:hypothetical protein